MEIEIIPAVMPKNELDLQASVSSVAEFARYVQIDFMDGVLTPETSWPYQDDNGLWNRIIEQEEGFPAWDKVNFEADLIIVDPERELDQFIAAGFQRIIFHLSSTKYPETFIKRAREAEIEVGVAFWHSDVRTDLYEIIDADIDYVQVMGIEKVGFQGQSFVEETLAVLADLRARYPELPLQVDGAVADDTIEDLAAAGANRFVSGSAIMRASDPHTAFNELYDLADKTLSTGETSSK